MAVIRLGVKEAARAQLLKAIEDYDRCGANKRRPLREPLFSWFELLLLLAPLVILFLLGLLFGGGY